MQGVGYANLSVMKRSDYSYVILFFILTSFLSIIRKKDPKSHREVKEGPISEKKNKIFELSQIFNTSLAAPSCVP